MNPGEKTVKLIQENVDEMVSVSDDEIAATILLLLEREKLVVEPAGASSLAAVLNHKMDVTAKRVVCVLSGGNIDVSLDVYKRQVQECLAACLQDRKYYQADGGVTFSGGEPLLQADVLVGVMQALKKEQITICVETSLYACLLYTSKSKVLLSVFITLFLLLIASERIDTCMPEMFYGSILVICSLCLCFTYRQQAALQLHRSLHIATYFIGIYILQLPLLTMTSPLFQFILQWPFSTIWYFLFSNFVFVVLVVVCKVLYKNKYLRETLR